MSDRPTCHWCGHPRHPHPCPAQIDLGGKKKTAAPCPCTRALKEGK